MNEEIDFIVVSDLHIGKEPTNVKKVTQLFKYVINRHPKYFILNGDILELLYKKKKDVLENCLFQKLLKVARKVKTIYIEGNHDPYKKIMKIQSKGHLPNIIVVKKEYYLSDYNLMIAHGSKFDTLQIALNKCFTWFYPILPLVWKKVLRPTPAQLKEAGKIEKYNLHASFTHQTALNQANKDKHNISIGHSHRSQELVDPISKLRVYVTSAWDNEFVLLMGENGLLRLVKF